MTAFTENLGLKFLSLAMALALFGWIHSAEDAQRSVAVEIEAVLPDNSEDRILVSEIPDQIKLRLRGNRSLLESLARTGLEPVQINLKNARDQYLYFDHRKFNLPATVRVTKVTPSYVALRWAKQVVRRLPVVARVTTSAKAGVRLDGVPMVNPGLAVVRGPLQELQQYQRLYTENIDLEHYAEGEHQVTVALQPLSDHLRYMNADTRVRVVFKVARAEVEKTFADIEVSLPAQSPLRAEPDHVAVTVKGDNQLIDKLGADSVHVFPIILAPDGPRQFNAELNVRLPEGVSVSKVVPSKIKLVQDKR